MPYLTAKCDSCGAEGEVVDFVPDYDGVIRCKRCDIKEKIMEYERSVQDLKQRISPLKAKLLADEAALKVLQDMLSD